MPIVRKVDDEIRVKVLEALIKPGSIEPNISQIQRYTGLNQATVRASIEFLEKNVMNGYSPRIDMEKMGFGLEVITIYQFDGSDKVKTKKVMDAMGTDPHIFYCYGMAGSTNWNLVTRQMFRDVESYLESVQDYYSRVPEMYELVQDKMVFYVRRPVYKKMSYTEAMVEILKAELAAEAKTGGKKINGVDGKKKEG